MHQIFIILQEKHKQQKFNVFTQYQEETQNLHRQVVEKKNTDASRN